MKESCPDKARGACTPSEHLDAVSQEPEEGDSLEEDLVPWQAMTTPSTDGGKQTARLAPRLPDPGMQHPAKQRTSATLSSSGDAATHSADGRSPGSDGARESTCHKQMSTLSRFAPALADLQRTDAATGWCAGQDGLGGASAKVRTSGRARLGAAAGNPFVAVGRTARLQVRSSSLASQQDGSLRSWQSHRGMRRRHMQ